MRLSYLTASGKGDEGGGGERIKLRDASCASTATHTHIWSCARLHARNTIIIIIKQMRVACIVHTRCVSRRFCAPHLKINVCGICVEWSSSYRFPSHCDGYNVVRTHTHTRKHSLYSHKQNYCLSTVLRRLLMYCVFHDKLHEFSRKPLKVKSRRFGKTKVGNKCRVLFMADGIYKMSGLRAWDGCIPRHFVILAFVHVDYHFRFSWCWPFSDGKISIQ